MSWEPCPRWLKYIKLYRARIISKSMCLLKIFKRCWNKNKLHTYSKTPEQFCFLKISNADTISTQILASHHEDAKYHFGTHNLILGIQYFISGVNRSSWPFCKTVLVSPHSDTRYLYMKKTLPDVYSTINRAEQMFVLMRCWLCLRSWWRRWRWRWW